MKYWYTKEVNLSFEEALDEVTLCLAEQGFWIMTKMNVQESLQKKLWRAIEKYVVLWACNPSLAYEALQVEQEIGLVLPCNVIVYEKDSKVFVSAIVPTVWIGFIENDKIKQIAQTAEEMLKKALDSML